MNSVSVSVVGSTQDLVTVSSRKAQLLRRSKLERRLLGTVAGLTVLGAGLVVAVVVLANQYNNLSRKWNKGICKSEQCIRSAAMLMESMDRSVSPCTDFYRYTCGRWSDAHPVGDSHIYNSWFLERQEHLQREVTVLLQTNETSSDPEPVKQAHRFFRSCVDTDALDEQGLEPIMEVLGNMSLPRALPNQETAKDFNLARTLAEAQRVLSMDILIEIGLDKEDGKDQYLLHLVPPHGANPLPDVLVDNNLEERSPASEMTARELVLVKVNYMTRVLALMDAWAHKNNPDYEVNATELSGAALKLLLTDTQINTMADHARDAGGNSKPQRMTLKRFERALYNGTIPTDAPFNTFNMTEYLEVLLKGINFQYNPNSYHVMVSDISYFKGMAQLLQQSKPETVQRLVWWKVVEATASHTTSVMRDLRHTMLSAFFKGLMPSPRPKFCVRAVKSFLHMALSYKMAVVNPLTDTANKVREMLSDINSAFRQLVSAVDWMDSSTKLATLDKASAVSSHIGYPEWLLQTGELDKFYQHLDLSEHAFLWNMASMKANQVTRQLVSLVPNDTSKNETNNERWTTDPIEVNAYYSRAINAICKYRYFGTFFSTDGQQNNHYLSVAIPAGILQVPFYFLGLEALNYGAIGTILGHELTHGFDVEGKDFDKQGMKHPWWHPKVTKEYNDRATCFVNQYDNYGPTTELKINGSHTLAENIADNGGVREALLAYRNYRNRHGEEPILPGFQDFTHDQLFFLGFANVWCQNADARFDALSLRDSHSPAKYRVIGALSNSPEFAEVWKCPVNSAMNPKNKCIIW